MNNHITATISCCQNLLRILLDSWLCLAFNQQQQLEILVLERASPSFFDSCQVPDNNGSCLPFLKSFPFKISSCNLLHSHLDILFGLKCRRTDEVTLCPNKITCSSKNLLLRGCGIQDLYSDSSYNCRLIDSWEQLLCISERQTTVKRLEL